MWAEIATHLPQYSDCVLTVVALDGFPFSIRCNPRLDPGRERLQIGPLPDLPLAEGPASLLCHFHDNELWNLKSFLVRGRLLKEENQWIFIPARFVDSGVSGSLFNQAKGLLKARKNARRYLEARGLSRPQVPWKDIRSLRSEVKK